MVESLETKLLGMLTLVDVDSLAYVSGILGLEVPEQKKGNRKLLLKYFLRQANSEGVDSSDYGCSIWYTKLHYGHLRVSFSKKAMVLSV